MIPASIDDLREFSRRRIPKLVFDYLDGGSGPGLGGTAFQQ
ncbi:hypothetical protein [Roseibium album]